MAASVATESLSGVRDAMSSSQLRCNICDEIHDAASVAAHLASRSHSIKKKVAEYNEMNFLLRHERDDRSVLQVWISSLYAKDAVSRESQA